MLLFIYLIHSGTYLSHSLLLAEVCGSSAAPDAHLVGEGLRVQQVCLCLPVSLSVYTVLLLA